MALTSPVTARADGFKETYVGEKRSESNLYGGMIMPQTTVATSAETVYNLNTTESERFTQEDTYLGDGRNLYVYVHSNPLKYVDPTGHITEDCFDNDGTFVDDWQENTGGGAGGNLNVSSGLNFTGTTATHMQNSGRYVPVQILQDAIKGGIASPDPQGTAATMYTSTMYKNGTEYNLEVLYNENTNTIYHFMYYR